VLDGKESVLLDSLAQRDGKHKKKKDKGRVVVLLCTM
jgi:hypothetical protein